MDVIMKFLTRVWLMLARTKSAPTAEQSTGRDTEFTAEIVRITRVEPHPNADRLELARFELSGTGETDYTVVVGRGEFKPGDLAAYFSVDCILPVNHPSFSFLRSRSDCQNKETYRLRAARLRGVFSQGLLVPPPVPAGMISGWKLGDSVSQTFGVTYHRSAFEETKGPTPASKKKPQPMPVYGVESLKKAPRLFDLDEEVVVTEKIHGCNMRFGWVRRRILGLPLGWRFVVGSHRAIKGDGSAGFYGEDVWVDAARVMRLADATRDYKGYIFFGELYGYTYSGKRLQDLTYGRTPESGPGLAIFDVRDPDGAWLPESARRVVLADTGLPGVPVLYRGSFGGNPSLPFKGTILALAEGMTTINAQLVSSAFSQIREGIVVEDLMRTRKAKFVGEGYLMRKGA